MVEILLGKIVQILESSHAGIVDQAIDRSEFLQGFFHDTIDIVQPRNVGGNAQGLDT